MKLPRPAQSFDNATEWDDYWSQRASEADDEAQAADDAWADRDEDDA